MKIIKEFFINNKCYYRLELHNEIGLRAVIRAGNMHVIDWNNEEMDVNQIINDGIIELKLRAKISTSNNTLCNIKRLLQKLENHGQTKLIL